MERFSPSRGFILDLGGWGLAVPFYSDQDCSFLSNSYMTLGAQSCAVQSWEDACIRPACNKWSPTRALIRGELSQVLPEPHLHSTVHLKYFFGAFAIPPSAANSGTAGKWNKFIKSEISNREGGESLFLWCCSLVIKSHLVVIHLFTYFAKPWFRVLVWVGELETNCITIRG